MYILLEWRYLVRYVFPFQFHLFTVLSYSRCQGFSSSAILQQNGTDTFVHANDAGFVPSKAMCRIVTVELNDQFPFYLNRTLAAVQKCRIRM